MSKIVLIHKELKNIKPYKNNPRIHDEKHINQIVNSIKKFDFTNPILVDENDEILAGHGRWLAAKNLNMTIIPCVVFIHLKNYSLDGSLHYLCMDWRHIMEIMTACKDVYSEFKNLCVWNKNSGGMGSLYRSKHELVFDDRNDKDANLVDRFG